MSGTLTNTPSTLIIRYPRSLSGIALPNCVIEETTIDELQITEHPVEQNANITDHAFKRPISCTVRWAWGNTGQSETYILDVYNQLLTLQASRQPVQLITGKRNFSNINMLIQGISNTTNEKSEYVLPLTIMFKQIILVSTSSTTVAPQSAQSFPASTSPMQNAGVQNPSPVSDAQNSSLISNSTGFLAGAIQ